MKKGEVCSENQGDFGRTFRLILFMMRSFSAAELTDYPRLFSGAGTGVGFRGAGSYTAVFRADQRTPENLLLYNEGLGLWTELSHEFDINPMLSDCDILDLAHSEKELRDLMPRAASG
jgi:hypothetical protein